MAININCQLWKISKASGSIPKKYAPIISFNPTDFAIGFALLFSSSLEYCEVNTILIDVSLANE